MPSFRVTLIVGLLKPEVSPEAIIPAVADAVARSVVVESADLGVVAGRARITVRFTGDDDRQALEVARGAAETIGALAEVERWFVTRRDGGRWTPVL